MTDARAERIVYTTVETPEQAREIARQMVEARLVACANILPGMVAVFRWNDAIAEGREVVVILKTHESRIEAAVARLDEIHPYETPAILVVTPDLVAPGYAAWLAAETKGD